MLLLLVQVNPDIFIATSSWSSPCVVEVVEYPQPISRHSLFPLVSMQTAPPISSSPDLGPRVVIDKSSFKFTASFTKAVPPEPFTIVDLKTHVEFFL